MAFTLSPIPAYWRAIDCRAVLQYHNGCVIRNKRSFLSGVSEAQMDPVIQAMELPILGHF
jgi:hypothetical protein